MLFRSLAKKYDAIMAGMNITPKRMETINFTTAYAAGAHGFLVMKNSSLTKMPGGEFSLTKDPAGAEKAIRILKTEFEKTMAYVGCRTVSELSMDVFSKNSLRALGYIS